MTAGLRLIRRALAVAAATHTGRSTKPHWRASMHAPSIAANRNGTPTLVCKIKIEPAGMLSDTDVDAPLGRIT